VGPEENRRVVRDAFTAWSDGTAPITDLFAPEMTWRIEGRSIVAKQYVNTQQFVDEVLVPFGARFSQGERFRPVDVRATYCDGDTVVVLWDGRGIANDGIPYENSYVWIMRLEAGKVVDATALFDSIAFDELWTRVTPA
jgi:ketosteroid isomerase-like protein